MHIGPSIAQDKRRIENLVRAASRGSYIFKVDDLSSDVWNHFVIAVYEQLINQQPRVKTLEAPPNWQSQRVRDMVAKRIASKSYYELFKGETKL